MPERNKVMTLRADLAAMRHAHEHCCDERDRLVAALEKIADEAERNGILSVARFARRVLSRDA